MGGSHATKGLLSQKGGKTTATALMPNAFLNHVRVRLSFQMVASK
jgi:hypothetical protein